MAAAFCRSGQISPTNVTRPLEKVFDDAQHTGQLNLMNRKLKEYPKLADKYDLVDTTVAGKFGLFEQQKLLSFHFHNIRNRGTLYAAPFAHFKVC